MIQEAQQNIITFASKNTSKIGYKLAKGAFKTRESTMTYSKKDFSIVQWGTVVQKTYFKRISYQIFNLAVNLTIYSQQLMSFQIFLFAYPITRITALAVTRVSKDILCEHTYLPTTRRTVMNTQFNSQVTQKVATVLELK